MRRTLWRICAVLLAPMLLAAVPAQAAEKKIALQISDGSQEKQELVLNVANNLIKAYGAENLNLEIVAFGPGLRLLFADNANRARVQSLAVTGVRFSACENTVQAMTRQLGQAPQLGKDAQMVPAGIVRLVDLSAQGYVVVRP